MKDIEILTFEKISDRSFTATGRIENRTFEARTIIYKGNPIFKIFEDGVVKTASESNFSVGEKMSVARLLKKYSQGKVDKLGRETDDPKRSGVGLVIQLQNKIDDLISEINRLESILEENNIKYKNEEEDKSNDLDEENQGGENT